MAVAWFVFFFFFFFKCLAIFCEITFCFLITIIIITIVILYYGLFVLAFVCRSKLGSSI